MSMELNRLPPDLPQSLPRQRENQAGHPSEIQDTSSKQTKTDASTEPQKANRLSAQQLGVAEQKKLTEVKDSIKELNKSLSGSALRFEIDREVGQTVIKIVDERNQEVIRQIPDEKTLQRLKQIKQYLENHVYDRHATSSDLRDQLKGLLLNNAS